MKNHTTLIKCNVDGIPEAFELIIKHDYIQWHRKAFKE